MDKDRITAALREANKAAEKELTELLDRCRPARLALAPTPSGCMPRGQDRGTHQPKGPPSSSCSYSGGGGGGGHLLTAGRRRRRRARPVAIQNARWVGDREDPCACVRSLTKDEPNFEELVVLQQKKPELTPRSDEEDSDIDSDSKERERALLELCSFTSQSRHHAGLALTLGLENGPGSWINDSYAGITTVG